MLSATHLACVRGERSLFHSLDFQVERGECLHVQGANGVGKTSLLRIVCGLAQPAQGQVLWDGQDTRRLGEAWHGELLFLGHQHALKEDLSARENLSLGARVEGQTLDEDRLQAALRRLGLQDCEDLPVRHLSQGQKRRVALTRLLTRRAALWVLDEPLTALDSTATGLIGELLDEHLARGGLALLTSHQPLRLARGAPRELTLVH